MSPAAIMNFQDIRRARFTAVNRRFIGPRPINRRMAAMNHALRWSTMGGKSMEELAFAQFEVIEET
jgi:hypothetical protein